MAPWRSLSIAVALGAVWLASVSLAAAAIPAPELGLRRGAYFYLDYDGNAVPNAVVGFGSTSDIGLVGDFDGDTLTDTAVYRAGFWFISLYNDSAATRFAAFGSAGDIPMAADVNGDGRADLVLYRPAAGIWYVNYSRNGSFNGVADLIRPFGGGSSDLPVLGDFDGDGGIDRAIYRQGIWYMDLDWNGTAGRICAFGGGPGDVPLAADFDGDGVADLAIFRAGTWHIDTDCDGSGDQVRFYGAAGDRPLVGAFDPANALFVNGSATSGTGSQRAPLTTIAAALARATPGVAIRVAAGIYPAPVAIVQRANLALIGAGWTATHLTGGGGPGSDALSIVLSTGISVRNLHVASPNQRGITIQGSSVSLDRVSTVGGHLHGVLATGYLGARTFLAIARSQLDGSWIGMGLGLDAGVTATLTASSVTGNGSAPPSQIPATGGRGIEVLGTSSLEVSDSTINENYGGGVLVDNTSAGGPGSVTVTDSRIERNGSNGLIYGSNTQGLVARNVISDNGQRGTPGASTGYNGIEVLSGWHGPSMVIDGNIIARNTGNGVIVGSGAVQVTNNAFDDNWLAMTIWNAPGIAANVTVEGNTFDTQPPTPNQTGIYIFEGNGNPIVRIGGPTTAQRNIFRNYLNRPAIACELGTAVTTCPLSWNQFVNSAFPVFQCHCTP